MVNLQFHSHFVYRFPLVSFVEKINSALKLKEVAQSQRFQETIYISSPTLYSELRRWLKNEIKEEKEVSKLISSLYKYYNRMSSRCTPYGLFASCGTGIWEEINNIVSCESIKTKTRFDMNFVCALSQYLSKLSSIQTSLLFFPNTSIYSSGDHLRYVEYKYINNKRVHSIISVDSSKYLLEVLNGAKIGAKINDLVKILVSQKIPLNEAVSFIHELIDCQLLISELEPTITGRNSIQQITTILNTIESKSPSPEISNFITLFEKTNAVLKKLELQTENKVPVYKELLTLFRSFDIPIEENFFFQVDSFSDVKTAYIDKSVQKNILSALSFLYKINSSTPNKNIEDFKFRFFENYGEREVSLAAVLDTESGIGYPQKDTSGLNTIIDDLHIYDKNNFSLLKWNEIENYLLGKVANAIEAGNAVIKFNDEDVKMVSDVSGRMPPTFSVMFKMINTNTGKIQLNFIGGGASAANLLGRFAYGDKKIHQIIKNISAFEENLFDDKIIAEIIHLPESRIGNILLRPVMRKYEIPYLAKSATSIDNQIFVDDLVVSVKKNRVVLKSRRLQREIVPRLSTAHNYNKKSLPIYQFLCDLQMQDIEKPTLTFSWGSLSNLFSFLPRAEYKNVVLFPATWNLPSVDFIELSKKISTISFAEEAESWQKKWKMPQLIVLKDGDNELLVDFENELSVSTFFDEIKNRSSIQVSEFLFDSENALIRNEERKPYTNEIIAVVFNHDYKPSESSNNNIKNELIKRSFIPGSEWLNFKIYCGVKTSDSLLKETIKPIIAKLLQNSLIEKWFFIRYVDPDLHIRLRFYNSDCAKLNEVMKLLSISLQRMHEQGIISKIMTDTYNRELERYGHNTMEISEHLFEIDSWATLNLLEIAQGDNSDHLKWQYSLKSLDNLMGCFGFNISQKLNLMEKLKTAFIAEHSTHKDLKVQLDNKFRKMRPQLNELFSNSPSVNNDWPASEILKWNQAAIQPIIDQILEINKADELMVNLDDLIASYMHMSINRIFKSQQRKHEMVIYDQLYRYYKSKIAQEAQK
jgi:thiopeptide-type bacteriocin biosynthesis protein